MRTQDSERQDTPQPWRERELELLHARLRDAQERIVTAVSARDAAVDALAEVVMVLHQRADAASCSCGWSELGKSHAKHVIAELRRSGVLYG